MKKSCEQSKGINLLALFVSSKLDNVYFFFAGVLEAVEKDFNMTKEWQGGLLQTAFIICYFASAPMFGYLGDRQVSVFY